MLESSDCQGSNHSLDAFNACCVASFDLVLSFLSSLNVLFKDDPSTNAGRGSNLTEDGHVECDASVMDGDSGVFGSVGAVPGIPKA